MARAGSKQRALTPEEESVVKGIVSARAKVSELEAAVETAGTQLNARVARALRQDIPAAVLADRLGVSTQRIYQMRDNTR